jgi:hypothetical protein
VAAGFGLFLAAIFSDYAASYSASVIGCPAAGFGLVSIGSYLC